MDGNRKAADGTLPILALSIEHHILCCRRSSRSMELVQVVGISTVQELTKRLKQSKLFADALSGLELTDTALFEHMRALGSDETASKAVARVRALACQAVQSLSSCLSAEALELRRIL